jgi:hypothetical protein
MEELLDQLDEMKAVLKSYDFDLEECEVDERECVAEHGEDLFRIYQLLREVEEIAKEE